MSIRESFVEHFGEENAVRVEEAALGHMNELAGLLPRNIVESLGPLKDPHYDDNWGSDPFRYLFMLCIGRDCFRIGGDHAFTMSEGDVRLWSREHADLLMHDGDPPDFLALVVGQYYGYIDWEKAAENDFYPPEGWREHDERQHQVRNQTPEERMAHIEDLIEQGYKLLDSHNKGPSEGEETRDG